MKLATITYKNTQCVARIEDEAAYIQSVGHYIDVLEFLDNKKIAFETFSELSLLQKIDTKEICFLAPIPRPRSNVMCLGLNYLEHVQENTKLMGREISPPEFPIVFTKAPSAVNSPFGDIELDSSITKKLDWEVELGVIIGKGGKGIKSKDAMQHVFGYTVLNDVTARDLQRQHKQFFIGKSLDGACPMGPVIVSADELKDPHNLRITSRVNGETQQDSNTQHMIFNIPQIIEILSRSRTLEVGDVIATGTPSGVGAAQDPARFLMPGDILESEIESIGVLRNKIISC